MENSSWVRVPRCNTCKNVWACTSRHALCFWSVLSNCCANQWSVLLCFLFNHTVVTITQTFTNRFRSRCHSDFPLRLLKLLLTVETKPVSHCQCVFRIVRPRKNSSAFHPTFLCRNSTDVRKPRPMRSQIFTLNTSRIKCSRSSAPSSGMSKMKSFLQCTPRTGSALSSAEAFSNRTRQASVCGPKPTQPLQPSVAPCLATTWIVKYTHRWPDGPWSCCVTIVAFKFSALPFQGSPRTFFNSLFTNLSSGGTRCNALAFWTPFSVRMMCSSVIGAFPTQIPWPHLWSRLPVATDVYLYITLSPNGNTWLVYAFPKTRTNAVLPSFLTWNLVKHHAACRINHAIKMLSLGSFSRRRSSSDNHIARQTPLITRFAFSILPWLWRLALGSCLTSVRLTRLLCTAFNSWTNTGSWSECSITTLCPSASTNPKIVSTRYSLNAFLGQSVAEKLSEPTSAALSEGSGSTWSSSQIREVKLNSWHGFICFWMLLPQMWLVRRSRRNAPLTPASIRHMSWSFVQRTSSAGRVAGPVRTLGRTAGSPSASNVAPAPGPGVPNAACSLASAACSTSASVIGLSSSVLASFDDNFEGLAATKNTPPLRIMSSSFPSSLDIQQRSFVKCTSHPESIMDPNDQIGRLTSNTL